MAVLGLHISCILLPMSKTPKANREPWKNRHSRKAEAINTQIKLPSNHWNIWYQIRHMRKGLLPHLRADFEEIKHKDWFKEAY